MRSHRIKLNQDMKSIYTVAAFASLAVLASCSSTTKTRAPQPQRLPQPAQASSPITVESPSNIDNMVYKERGEAIFSTGRSGGGAAHYTNYGRVDDNLHTLSGGALELEYTKTGAKTARMACLLTGHSGYTAYLRFSTPTSGYLYRVETFNLRYGEESVSNERIPFTLERR